MSSAADAIIDLYTRHADAFDRRRGRTMFEQPWLKRFADRLPHTGRVLDIGCGAGEPIARYFIDQGHAVTGIDASPPLIDMCTKRFPGQEWLVADMRELKLDRTFDGLIAWHSFFHLSPDDQRRMFPIFREHSTRGSVLMFTAGPRHGDAIGSLEGEPLYHGSLDPEEYRQLMAQNDFAVLDYVAEDQECGGATIWLAKKSE